jgi:D-amino peptidase
LAKQKRIYISVDFEGAACVIGNPSNPTEPLGSGLNTTTQIFQQAQRLVTGEVNAAVRGALAGGATEVIVEDAHGSGHSLLYEEIHPEAKVLMGSPRPSRFCMLDETFSGMLLLCYHAMAGARGGILSHSYSSMSVHRLALNGRSIGEMAIDAAIAGARGVPVIFVSSDEAGCTEARKFLGRDIVTVATKKGISRNCALSLSPAKSQELTEAGVQQAVERCGDMKPYRMSGPFVLERTFKWESQADSVASGDGAERINAYTIRYRAKNMEELSRYV